MNVVRKKCMRRQEIFNVCMSDWKEQATERPYVKNTNRTKEEE